MATPSLLFAINRCIAAATAGLLLLSAPAAAQAPSAPTVPAYATLAKAFLAAPVVARATVRSTSRPPRDTAPPPPGQVQMLVTVDVQAVLKAPDPVPARLTYLWQGPADARGRAPDLRKQSLLLFLQAVSGFDGQYRLVGSTPQLPATPAAEATLRAIASETQDRRAATMSLTAVRGAIDLGDESGPAVGFVIDQRRAPAITVLSSDSGARISWSDTDMETPPIRRNSLVWYHLACTLPRDLPADVIADYASGEDSGARRAAVRAAWARLLSQLGLCA